MDGRARPAGKADDVAEGRWTERRRGECCGGRRRGRAVSWAAGADRATVGVSFGARQATATTASTAPHASAEARTSTRDAGSSPSRPPQPHGTGISPDRSSPAHPVFAESKPAPRFTNEGCSRFKCSLKSVAARARFVAAPNFAFRVVFKLPREALDRLWCVGDLRLHKALSATVADGDR